MITVNANKNVFVSGFFLMLFSLLFVACKKLVEVGPRPGTIQEENLFTTNSSAISMVNGMYVTMSSLNGSFVGSNGFGFYTGLAADEFTLFSGAAANTRFEGYFTNTLSANASLEVGHESWAPLYNLIFRCNAAIKGLEDPAAQVLSPLVRKQLMGEARFLRAFYYFYLVNMYGELPLVTGNDPFINSRLSRSPVDEIYNLIIDDLIFAKGLLSEKYPDATLEQVSVERVRPTIWAASALLARVYLYKKKYDLAEATATEVISHSVLYDTTNLNSVFLKNSREAIWQLQPIDNNFNTRDARLYIVPPTGPSASIPVWISSSLEAAFEIGDKRAVYGNWLDTTIYLVSTNNFDTVVYPFKYKANTQNTAITGGTGFQAMTEYTMVLRLAEQYLIRAEARTQQNNLAGGIADLDVIRKRAGLPLVSVVTPGISQTALLDKILNERRVEFFSEWGHRWFDLKRSGKLDQVMSVATPIKSQGLVPWRAYQQLFPIPLGDIENAVNLTQNPGY